VTDTRGCWGAEADEEGGDLNRLGRTPPAVWSPDDAEQTTGRRRRGAETRARPREGESARAGAPRGDHHPPQQKSTLRHTKIAHGHGARAGLVPFCPYPSRAALEVFESVIIYSQNRNKS